MSIFRVFKSPILAIILCFFFMSTSAQNLLTNGDFEEGIIEGFDINGNGYNQLFPPFTGTTNPGDFAFVSDPQDMNTNFFISGGDHTTGNGLMLAFDGNTVGGQQRLWRAGDGGTGLCCLQPGTTYRFSYWIKSIATSVTGPVTQSDIGIQINNANNVTITSGQAQAPLPSQGWQQVTYSFVATNTCVNIELWNNNTNPVGNDFALDDMQLVSLGDPLAATFSKIDINCPQDETGFVGIYPLGGVPPFTFTITKPGFFEQNGIGIFEELAAGEYLVEVTDDVGNKISFLIEILIEEEELSVSPNQTICFGETTTIQAFSEFEVTWTSNPEDDSMVDLGENTLQVSPTETTFYFAEIEYDKDIDVIFNGDFTEGNEGFSSDYTFLETNPSGNQGAYGVVENASTWFAPFQDCTAQLGNNFLVADGATENNCKDKLWCQSVFIIPGQEYEFKYWIQTVNDVDINPANIVVEINGNIIGQDSSPTLGCNWEERSYIWNSTGTVAEVCIYNTEKEAQGNDFALDNIQFLTAQTCIETKRVRVNIENCFCPEIENPQGEQSICQDEALSPISVDIVLDDFQDEVSFVYFTTPQVGNQMYQGGSLLGQQLATTTATYNFPPLGQLNSLPNIPDTYYVYVILSNLPPNVNCRPFAEIIITIEESFTPVFTAIPEDICEDDVYVLPSISENGIEGTWSPSDEVFNTGIYTFLPDSNLCIETVEVEIIVVPDEQPSFDLPSNICSDGFIDFPLVSNNGYQGTWSPPFNPDEETTYTFTPLEEECTEQTFSITIDVVEIVFNDELIPLEVCDENNDGFFAGFDLASKVDEVTFGNSELEVTFHLTQNDAIINMNPVDVPYSNVNPNQQTLYVRVENPENNCFKTTSLELIIHDSPLLQDIEPFVLCDTFEVGINFFDLTSIEDDLFVPGQDTTDFEISYHQSFDAANNNTSPIVDPTDYLMQVNPQTVYVRVTDPNSPLGCYNIEPIELIVDPLPQITPPSLIANCEDETIDGNFDYETSIFDLSQKIPEITNNNNSLVVAFYESLEDQTNGNPITNIETYQNTNNPQNIRVSVFSQDTGCEATTFLTLIVDPLPSIPEPDPLVVCDADNEGTSEFDLLAAIDVILDGEINTQITFHLTEAEAVNGDNAILIEDEDGNSILYQNLNPFNQTLYVRAENVGDADISGSGCFVTWALPLEVRISPIIQNLEDLVICDDETLNGFAAFNLAQNTPNAIGGQEESVLNVTYHKTQQQAEEGTNAIAVPSNFTNDTNPQTIYVRIEDQETGCIDQFGFGGDNSFTISVESYPELTAAEPLKVCNTQANPDVDFPTGIFNLTIKEEELTGLSPIPANISFTYYESQIDLDNQENAIEDPTEYINSTNPPMSVFVESTDHDTVNQCSDVIALIIDVLPYPFPVELTPEERRLIACDNNNNGVASEPFDLTLIRQQITGSENNIGSYYLSQTGAFNEDETEEIPNPNAYINDPSLNEVDEDFFPTNTQIIWLRLDSNAAGNFCFVIVPIELIVEPIPEINPAGSPFGYTLCQDDPTQLPSTEEIAFSLYDLTDGSPADIIPVLDPNSSQDQTNYEYSLHLNINDAENGINPLGPGYQASNEQILFLRVTHIVTECANIDNIAEVQINIEPRPVITDDDLNPIVVCADEQVDGASQDNNQEVATVDLTQKDEEIDPNFNDEDSDTIVEYYATEEDYTNGIAIQNPSNYTTTVSPTTIIAEVIDLNNFCNSLNTQSFDIFVNPIPLVDISEWDGAIICINPQTGEVIENDFSPPTLNTGLNEDDYSFEWALNANPIAFTGSAYTPQVGGVYTVTVTDLTNNLTSCQASSSVEVFESNAPSFQVNILSQAFDGSHSLEIINIQGDGNYEFSIDNGPWRSLTSGETSIIFTGLEAGERIVRGRDVGGCGALEIAIFLIDYPRFFTPNEDGYNDTWNIIGLANQQNAKIYIFDRFGKLLKELSPSGPGWDGTFNGKPMIGNDYWFSVEYNEPSTGVSKEFRANFTLKR